MFSVLKSRLKVHMDNFTHSYDTKVNVYLWGILEVIFEINFLKNMVLFTKQFP